MQRRPARPARRSTRAKSATSTASPAVASVADRFFRWAQQRLGKRAVTDVFGWVQNGRPRFAFTGAPRTLSLAFRLGEMPDGQSLSDKYPFNRRFRPSYGSGASRGGDEMVLDELFGVEEGHAGYWSDAPGPHDILNGLIRYAEVGLNADEDTAQVTLIPSPGHPWYGNGTVYYSARTKRWVKARRPTWASSEPVLARVGGEEVYAPSVRWCTLAPTVRCARGGSAMLTGRGGEPVLFTHSFHLADDGGGRVDEYDESVARAVRDCGGLMFPSLAVASIPAPNFLPGVMLIDPSSVLNALKSKGGREPVARVYNADVWTATVRSLETEIGPAAYSELAGQLNADDFMERYHQHFWSAGLPAYHDFGGWRPEGAKELKTLDAIIGTVGRYSKRWRREYTESPAAFRKNFDKARGGVGFAGNSAFLEAKISGVLSLSCVRAVCVPDYAVGRYKRFLAAMGYRGPVLVVQTSGDEERAIEAPGRSDDGDHARYVYAWRVSDMIVASLTRKARR